MLQWLGDAVIRSWSGAWNVVGICSPAASCFFQVCRKGFCGLLKKTCSPLSLSNTYEWSSSLLYFDIRITLKCSFLYFPFTPSVTHPHFHSHTFLHSYTHFLMLCVSVSHCIPCLLSSYDKLKHFLEVEPLCLGSPIAHPQHVSPLKRKLRLNIESVSIV